MWIIGKGKRLRSAGVFLFENDIDFAKAAAEGKFNRGCSLHDTSEGVLYLNRFSIGAILHIAGGEVICVLEIVSVLLFAETFKQHIQSDTDHDSGNQKGPAG